jgi:hypothetical protein
MIQMIMATIGGSPASHAAHAARQQQALMARKAVGFAILSSGLAVIVAQALQHLLGA